MSGYDFEGVAEKWFGKILGIYAAIVVVVLLVWGFAIAAGVYAIGKWVFKWW